MLDLNSQYREQCYQQQNIQLRREIRELDMRINYRTEGDPEPNYYCHFLVVGPRHSGKTSLLRSLQFALNGSQGWGMEKRDETLTVEIKRGFRWTVQGAQELKETDRKYSIQGLQLRSDQKASIRYKRALEYVESGYGGCIQHINNFTSRQLARVCLVCISACNDLTHEQITYLKFLKVDLAERHIKILFLLTNTDELSKRLRESQQFLQLDRRIEHLMHDLDIKQRQDVYCLQNYQFEQQHNTMFSEKAYKKSPLNHAKETYEQGGKVQNNEQMNFYLLQLLQRIVHESEEALKARTTKQTKSWFCGWT